MFSDIVKKKKKKINFVFHLITYFLKHFKITNQRRAKYLNLTKGIVFFFKTAQSK